MSGKPAGYWDKERCYEAALKCKNRTELNQQYPSQYESARKNKWLDDICGHMIRTVKSRNYWNYETCKAAALNYTNRFDFSHKCSGAYYISWKNGWLDEFIPILKKY